MKEEVFNIQGTLVEYDPETKIMYITASGRIIVKNSQLVFKAQLDFSKNNKILGMVIDISGLFGTFTMMNEELAKEIFPTLIKRGLICNAVIVSKDIFSQYSADELTNKMNNLETRTFENYDEAVAWMKSKVKI